MSNYRAEARADASVERTFEVFIDASRFSQWQALAVGVLDQTGPLTEPGASVRIDHGPGMKRTMTILEADPPNRLRYRQRGMGFDDTTTAVFEPDGGGTRVTLSSALVVAGGPLGRAMEWLGGRTGSTQKEYQEELDRFAAVASRRPVEPGPVGSFVTADCGVGFRVLKILAVDPDKVQVGLLPGVAPKRPEPRRRADGRLGVRECRGRELATRRWPGPRARHRGRDHDADDSEDGQGLWGREAPPRRSKDRARPRVL
jgi:uncharacterized protein YndB with AHSA1/START domain